jgi:hypothetical protein
MSSHGRTPGSAISPSTKRATWSGYREGRLPRCQVASPQRTPSVQNHHQLPDEPSRPVRHLRGHSHGPAGRPRRQGLTLPARRHPVTAPAATNGSVRDSWGRFAQGNPCRPPRHRNRAPSLNGLNRGTDLPPVPATPRSTGAGGETALHPMRPLPSESSPWTPDRHSPGHSTAQPPGCRASWC